MRSWYPIPASELDDKRLLGEHVELHAIFSIISKIKRGQKTGYAKHPEVLRWLNHAPALMARHNDIAFEMVFRRGFRHKSPIELLLVNPTEESFMFPDVIEPESEMRRKLQEKIERSRGVVI